MNQYRESLEQCFMEKSRGNIAFEWHMAMLFMLGVLRQAVSARHFRPLAHPGQTRISPGHA
jgi:hypothetical protein